MPCGESCSKLIILVAVKGAGIAVHPRSLECTLVDMTSIDGLTGFINNRPWLTVDVFQLEF